MRQLLKILMKPKCQGRTDPPELRAGLDVGQDRFGFTIVNTQGKVRPQCCGSHNEN